MKQTIGKMLLRQEGETPFLTFPAFEKYPFVKHAFTTRLGGVSKEEFSSLNMNFGRGDSDENVLENYRRICKAVGFPFEKLVASAQDHHTTIRRVSAEQAGIGILKPRDLQSIDGLCTNEPGVTLVTYYADCVPLYFLDPVTRSVGLAHAGWRGTVAKIGAVMVEKMAREFGSNPKDIIAGIGPSIGPCCYEVDEPVANQFLALTELSPENFVREKQHKKYDLNLWECNRAVLQAAGIPKDQIFVGELCTKCHPELFFSHRMTGPKRGGMAAMICLTELE